MFINFIDFFHVRKIFFNGNFFIYKMNRMFELNKFET